MMGYRDYNLLNYQKWSGNSDELAMWEKELMASGWIRVKTARMKYPRYVYGRDVYRDTFFVDVSFYDSDGNIRHETNSYKIENPTKYSKITLKFRKSYDRFRYKVTFREKGCDEKNYDCWGTLHKELGNVKRFQTLLTAIRTSYHIPYGEEKLSDDDYRKVIYQNYGFELGKKVDTVF